MQIEEVTPNKPNFAVVVVLFAATILVIIIAAVAVVSWRARTAKKGPFTKHPLSMLSYPGQPPVSLEFGQG